MKTRSIALLMLSLFFIASCHQGSGTLSSGLVNNPNSASGTDAMRNLPIIVFEESSHDFGKIIEGETVSYNFKFKNIGKTDLIIADVSSSCGCTVPTYPKTPVGPGKEGSIRVTFNSQGKRGNQYKNVIVVANTQPNTTTVHIKALVVTPGSQK